MKRKVVDQVKIETTPLIIADHEEKEKQTIVMYLYDDQAYSPVF
jgi:hypothetical protein